MENLKCLYHVADPAFWEFWRKNGSSAGVEKTPEIGEQRLYIRYRNSPIHFLLTGGTVTGVELIAEKPRAIVRVKLTNAPRSIKLTLFNGAAIQYRGEQDWIQLKIDAPRDDGPSPNVFCDYRWTRPHQVSFLITDVKQNDEYWAKGHMRFVDLERMLLGIKRVPVIRRNRSPVCIAMRVTNFDEKGSAPKPRGTLFFPPEVSVRTFLEALADLLPFADFARSLEPQPKRRRASA